MTRISRAALASACVAASLAAGSSSAVAAVTIGQTGPPVGFCSQNQEWAQQVVSSGNVYIVPSISPATALSITSWSHQAPAGPNQKLKFKVYRPIMGLTYRVVAEDIRSLTPSVLNTFSSNIPVSPGDILGISNGPGTPNIGCGFGAFSETDLTNSTSNAGLGVAPGGEVTFMAIGGARLNISAVVEPTNTFTFGRTALSKAKGTATLTLDVPNPGEVTVGGTGVAGAAGAVAAKSVPEARQISLTIKAKGKKKKKLNQTGKVKLTPSITYTPTGGSSTTQSTTLKLKKR